MGDRNEPALKGQTAVSRNVNNAEESKKSCIKKYIFLKLNLFYINFLSCEVYFIDRNCWKENGLRFRLTLGGGGLWLILKKISCKRLSEEKNCVQHKSNRKLMGKKGKKYPAHQIARKKKIPDDQKSPTPAQELNGRPLNELIERSGAVSNVCQSWHL